jgi:glycosyltransferase involved in cell wall biosynthesis
MHPIVSVIVPCYGQAHLLPQAVASVQAQSMPNWELLVVDDGSPDDTAQVTESLVNADARVRLLRQRNGGLSAARNAGVAASRGEYIQFLDADDVLMPRKLEIQLGAHRNLPDDSVTYTDYLYGTAEDPWTPIPKQRLDIQFRTARPIIDFAARWEFAFSIPIHSALIPRALVSSLDGPFDTSLPNHEDWDFWMRLCGVAKAWLLIEEGLAVYRVSTSSMSRDRNRMWSGFSKAIAKHWRLQRNDREVIEALTALAYANDYYYYKRWPGWLRRTVESPVFSRISWRAKQILDPARRTSSFEC